MAVCVLGSINWDSVAHVADLPRRGETILSHRLTQSPGGKGLNQAVASARFGAATRLIGAVGKDTVGGQLRAFLRSEGIDDADVRDVEGVPTGQAYICLDANGDNLIVVTQGSNAVVGAAEVATARLDGATVFLAQFEMPLPAIETFFRAPAALGGTKILNAAPSLLAGKSVLALADIVVVNETELEHLSSRRRGDIAAAARNLIGANQTIIVTLGAGGAVAVDRQSLNAVPGHVVTAVDSVGAGDCFCGVLAAALAGGAGLVPAMRLANAAAALSVGCAGAAQSMPSGEEIRAFLA
ncbi:MAG TPA: ribokinase [Rhizomicrobium sp.]|nr:ribokinase [Rhizomicrobium sp.]